MIADQKPTTRCAPLALLLALSVMLPVLGVGPADAQLRCPESVADKKVAYAIAEGLSLTTTGGGGETVDYRPEFGEAVIVHQELPAAEAVFISDRESRRCGWADRRFILSRADPLRAGDVDPLNQGSRLWAKALVRNDPESAQAAGRTTTELRVPIFHRPGGEKRADVGVFGAFFVYAAHKVGAEEFLLIGGDVASDGGKGLVGWLRRSDLYFWDNRVSLHWGASPAQNRIWRNESHWLDNGKEIASGPSVWREPVRQNIPRFAMLNRKKYSDRQGTLFTIAFFGGATDATNRNSPVPETTVLTWLYDVRKLVENARNVEVLFVVDGTESMTRYFEPVVRAVSDVAQEVKQKARGAQREGRQSQIRFGVAVYSDYETKAAQKVRWEMVAPFGDFNDASNIAPLLRRAKEKQRENRPFLEDPIGGLPEAAYAGLAAAIDTATWSPQSELRMVVWIGDHGNHEKDDRFIDDPYTPGDVAKRLKERKIAFVPINVRGAYNKTMNERFLRQAQTIVDAAGVPFFGPHKTYSDNAPEDLEGVVARVSDVLRFIVAFSERVPDIVRGSNRAPPTPTPPPPTPLAPRTKGGPSASAKQAPPASDLDNPSGAQFVKDWLKMYETGGRPIGDVYKLNQAVTDGFAFHRDTTADWSFWVAMEPGDPFDALYFAVRGLCRGLGRGDPKPALEAIFKRLTEAMGGDPYKSNESIPQYLERVLNLPVEYFPTLLNGRLDQLVDWATNPENAAAKEKVRRQVCKSATLLNLVDQHQRIDPSDLVYDENEKEWKLRANAPSREFEWDWGLLNGVKYKFLPVDYLPKDP